MTPFYQSDDATVWVGDCREVLPRLSGVHACVTDPPYELNFMGKAWDATGVAFQAATWEAVAAALLPGAHLLSFGGTRTSHRMTCAIEDAGFEIRDSLLWLYATGFPKSLDVGKAFDRAAGVEREVVGRKRGRYDYGANPITANPLGQLDGRQADWERAGELTAPATDLARQWDGWGTALKPAHESVTVARKPLVHTTVAANVAAHGTGALNIDGCRIGQTVETWPVSRSYAPGQMQPGSHGVTQAAGEPPAGRWPANVAFSHHPECNGECHPACAVAELDRQSGVSSSGRAGPIQRRASLGDRSSGWGMRGEDNGLRLGDTGGASRFFFCAKPSRQERDLGCEGLESSTRHRVNAGGLEHDPKWGPVEAKNVHPCVKPTALLQWLVRLVTPPGGIVVDPFMGSGSTGIACIREGFRFIGIEQNEEYARIAVARLKHARCETGLFAEARIA